MAPHKLSILVEAIGAAKANKQLKGIDATISKIGGRAGQGLRTAGNNLKTLGVVAGGVLAGGVVASIKAAADFESQLNTINTVADVTPKKLAAIGDQIRSIAKSTGTPLEELTQGYYDLVSAGIGAGQANKVLAASNTLAIGGLSTAAESVDLITTALNSYGVAAKDQGAEAARFADIFAKSIETGKVTAAELAQTFAGVGPIAATTGIEIEELAAGYATLTAKGVPAAEAATQMESAMVALMRKTGPLKKLEKQTKRNYAAIAGSKGLAAAFEQMRIDAKKAGVPLIELVGRKEALSYVLNTTGDAMEGYNKNLADMQDAEGTAARQMASRQQGLNFQLSRLKALALDAGITIGNKLLPKITPLAERAVAFLATHEDDIERFGDNIAKGFDKALAFAERIPWGTIGAGLQVAADWAGKLMDVFLGMPPEVQTTLIALAGLNKLSGGAIGGIVGELGKGLIKGVLGMNAGVVNINAATVNGGGLGGGIAGKGGSVLGTAARIVVPLAVGLAIGEAIKQASGQNQRQWETTVANSYSRMGGGQPVTLPTPVSQAMIDAAKAAGSTNSETIGMRRALEQQKTLEAQSLSAFRASERAFSSGLASVRQAINAKSFAPRVTLHNNVYTSVSLRSVTRGQTTISRYGQFEIL